jgi:hypothetical protein
MRLPARRAAASRPPRQTEVRWPRELLADRPVEVKTIELSAEAAGFFWTTMRRAASDLGVISSKASAVADGPWEWRLPHNKNDTRSI